MYLNLKLVKRFRCEILLYTVSQKRMPPQPLS